MTSLLATACAVGAVVAALHRPGRPHRFHGSHRPRRSRASRDPLAALGRRLRRLLGRRSDRSADRRAGAVAVLCLVTVAAGAVPGALLAGAALVHTRWRRLRTTDTHDHRAVQRDLPELIDLLTLAVGAGLSVPAALPIVAEAAPALLRPDLLAAVDAIAAGRPVDEAVVELGRRWGSAGRPLVHVLADHLRYGTPALPALERVAIEARADRRRAAETRARKLPVLLLFPLVLCTLPAFGLLTVAPLVAGTFDALDGGHLEAPASPTP